MGGVLLDDKPSPVLALQVKDTGKAKDAFGDLVRCADAGKDVGWTLTDDYLVVSDSTSHAEAIVAAGRRAPLAEDAAYQKWTDEAGGDGIVNAYVARAAVQVLQRGMKSGLGGLGALGAWVAWCPVRGSPATCPAVSPATCRPTSRPTSRGSCPATSPRTCPPS